MPGFRLPDGAAMAYAEHGAGRPILLVHGWAAHGGFFDALAARLAQSHRVLVPTLRAHPGSEPGQAPLTIETLADDLCAFAEALELKQCIAVGWSMGAMALWAAAPRLAARLDGLVVEDMSPLLTNDSEWRFGLAGGYGAADIDATLHEIEADWPAYVARFAPRMVAAGARDAHAELIAWAQAEMSRAEPGAMAAYWRSMAGQDFRAALGKIKTPMRALYGAASQVYPEGASAFIERAAPAATRVAVNGAGHVPHLEAPDVFLNEIEAFVRITRRPDLQSGGATP